MWGPVTAAGTPVTCSITWTENSADFESPPITKADTSVSYDYPAYVSMRPPVGSLAAKWHGVAQTDVMFALTFPIGTTVDFFFDFVLPDFGGAIPGPTIIAGTAGGFYHKTVHNVVPNTVNYLIVDLNEVICPK
jgi:hypothetical protein